jgi:hypothetical protein
MYKIPDSLFKRLKNPAKKLKKRPFYEFISQGAVSFIFLKKVTQLLHNGILSH